MDASMPARVKKHQDGFRVMLQAKQEQLLAGLRRRDGIEVETAPDALDNQQQALEREVTMQNLERDFRLLRHVRAALRRLEVGDYGTCQSCEEEISARRLAAVPWAAVCIRCQEAADRGGLAAPEETAELV